MTPCSRVINIDQSPAAPYREICLIKLGKIIGVRLDGINCPDDRRGRLSTPGKSIAGCPALPSRRCPCRSPRPPSGAAACPAGATPTRPTAVRPSARLNEGCTCDFICCLSRGAAPADSPCLFFFFFCFTLRDSDALFPSLRRHLGIISNRSRLPLNFPTFSG